MFRNYFKVALRSLLRNKVFSVINMFGLSLGVAGSLLLFVYVNHELNYDVNIPAVDDVYQVLMQSIREGQSPTVSRGVSTLFSESMEDKLPGVESITRLSRRLDPLRINNEIFLETGLATDPTVFTTLGIKMIEGNPETALEESQSVVITPTFAERHFPDGSPIGQELEVRIGSEYFPCQVTGIVADPPKATSFEYGYIYNYELPYKMIRKSYSQSWGMTWSSTYLRLKPGITPTDAEAAIEEVIVQLGVNEDPRVDRHFFLQPVRDTHIALNNPEGYPTDVDGTAILVLSLIALVILLIASINFMTLSIGRSSSRVVEVGMRKVLGAGRGPLMGQFWTETGVLAFGAMLLGFLLTELALPTFGNLTGRELSMHYDGRLLAISCLLWLLLVFVAGSYPALVLSRFQPSQAFKGKLQTGGKGRLRKALVLVQFSLSIGLVGVLLVMDSQLKYVSSRDLGFAGSQVFEIPIENNDETGAQIVARLQSALAGDASIESISGSSASFDRRWIRLGWSEDDGSQYEQIFANIFMPGAITTLDLPLIAGRDFESGNQLDEKGRTIIVNEALVDYFGWDDPIGKILPGKFDKTVEVIGVMKNFHYASLHDEIRPLMIMGALDGIMSHEGGVSISLSSWYTIQNVLVRTAPGQLRRTLNRIEDIWPTVAPDFAFEPQFLDETVRKLYEEDKRWNSIVRYGSLIALIIATLGLLGLSTLEVAQRQKEIGIRKILGASTQRLVVMLGQQMTLLVLIAACIALPGAYFVSQRWLDGFAYRVPISPFVLLTAFLISVAIAWVTVGSLAWRAATRNPVETLRHE